MFVGTLQCAKETRGNTVESPDITSSVLDHYGLVAAICKELRIAERIDEALDIHDSRRKVSTGQAVVAMIINGLGFTNRRLYLVPQFFQNKPVEKLIGPGLAASDFHDDTLGRSLDDITSHDATKLFATVAYGIAAEKSLFGKNVHIDSTSFSVEGQYEKHTDDTAMVHVTHGFSKDLRPDLKQIILSLVTTGPAEIPIWMESLDGNMSDKVSFHETISSVRAFNAHLSEAPSFRWIADSALYSKEKLLRKDAPEWITRVPESITEARLWLEEPDNHMCWEDLCDGYKVTERMSCYGNITHRWVLVFSEAAYEREKHLFEKRILKEKSDLLKALWHLENKIFSEKSLVKESFDNLVKEYPYFQCECEIYDVKGYKGKGRPKLNEEPSLNGYQIKSRVEEDATRIEEFLNKKGRFILATNVDLSVLSAKNVLSEYKDQQQVERGFRFLKDPFFMSDTLFVKTPRRMVGMCFVMTLCLLVYNYFQYYLRKSLKERGESVQSQTGKPIQNPTPKWIFQMMEGIACVEITTGTDESSVIRKITNITKELRKIISIFGIKAQEIYGTS